MNTLKVNKALFSLVRGDKVKLATGRTVEVLHRLTDKIWTNGGIFWLTDGREYGKTTGNRIKEVVK